MRHVGYRRISKPFGAQKSAAYRSYTWPCSDAKCRITIISSWFVKMKVKIDEAGWRGEVRSLSSETAKERSELTSESGAAVRFSLRAVSTKLFPISSPLLFWTSQYSSNVIRNIFPPNCPRSSGQLYIKYNLPIWVCKSVVRDIDDIACGSLVSCRRADLPHFFTDA